VPDLCRSNLIFSQNSKMEAMQEIPSVSELDRALDELLSGVHTIGGHLEEAGQQFPWISQLIETLIENSGILAHSIEDDVSVLQPLMKAYQLQQLLDTENESLEKCILYYLLSVDQILAGKNNAAEESMTTEEERMRIAGIRSKDLAAACRRLLKPLPEGT
jgi:hypothetical protein